MATDLLDVVIGGFWSNVGGGLKSVMKFVGDSGIAKKVGNKVLVSTTSGAAGIEALAPATQLMEKAIAGDVKAKEMVAALATKAEGGDKLAKNAMGVLDIAAAGLRAAKKTDSPEVAVGKSYPYWVRNADGTIKKHSKLAHAIAWMAKHPGSKPANFSVTPQGKGQKTRQQIAQPLGRAAQRPTPGKMGPQSQQRLAALQQRRQGSQLVNQQQIAQSMQNMTPQQQQVFQQNLLAQQQANIQQGMLQQQYDPYGYPMGYQQQSGYPASYGYPQQQQPYGYAQQSGYPAGYAIPMQTGFPSGYVQQEQFEDVPPDDLMGDTVADVEINDEAEAE
jgi:hypothetical protein